MPKLPPEFGACHLQNVQIESVNFAWSEFSCSFNRCVCKNVNLLGSMFDSCSVFRRCDFSDTRLRVVADAALFESARSETRSFCRVVRLNMVGAEFSLSGVTSRPVCS